MIKEDKIKVSISYRNITHYIKLGYDPVLNEELEIYTNHLPSSSHVKIDVVCSLCKTENKIIYSKYIDNIKRHGFYGCRKCSRQKAALTSLDKYGVDNYSKTDEFKKRVENTNIKKYGFKTNLISPEHIENNKKIMMEKYNTDKFYEIRNRNRSKFSLNKDVYDLVKDDIFRSEDLYDINILNNEYLTYRNECRRITKGNIKLLIKNWDGYDYYDGLFIGENFKLDHNHVDYPTIE